MGVFAFEQGAAVHMEGMEYRLLQQIDTYWQLQQAKTGRIREVEHDDLLRMYLNRTLTVSGADSKTSTIPARYDLSEKELEVAKIRRAYVTEVLSLSTTTAVEEAIDRVWNRVKKPARRPSYTTVWRWKSRYISSDKDYRALVDNNLAKGNRHSSYPQKTLDVCRQAIEAKFMTRERPTVKATYEDALIRLERERRLSATPEKIKPPTLKLISGMIKKIPEFDKCAARYGRDEARKRFRSVKGAVVTRRPLQRAEIDHTQLDLIVVDDNNPELKLGRLWVTACIDDYTRCVLGVYIGFTPPSIQSVAACLKDSFLPKLNLREEFPEIENDWPAYGVMSELVLDNGREFHSSSLEEACYSLGIELHYAPRRTGWAKGKIERWLRTMNEHVAHGRPGTTFRSIAERGDYNSIENATIRLSTAVKMIRLWIADIYHQEIHSSLETSPAQMWRSSITHQDIPLVKAIDELDVILGRVYQRTIDHEGIEFEGLHYNSLALSELRKRKGEKLKVQIRVDETNIGHIYVLSPSTPQPIKVPALEFDYANGRSLPQHKITKANLRQESNETPDAEALLRAKKRLDQLVHADSALKRNRTSKRVARYREDSARNMAKNNTLIESVGEIDPVMHEHVNQDQDTSEPMPFCDLKPVALSVSHDDQEEFTAIYKGGFENGY